MNKKLEGKYTENIITACEEGIHHGKIIQGENFDPNVYAIYYQFFNGFYLYEMKKNVGLIGMTGTNNLPIPWAVSYSTASQKYAVLTVSEIPEP